MISLRNKIVAKLSKLITAKGDPYIYLVTNTETGTLAVMWKKEAAESAAKAWKNATVTPLYK